MAESVPGSTRLLTSGGGLKAENTLGTRLRKRQAREKSFKTTFFSLTVFFAILMSRTGVFFYNKLKLKANKTSKKY